MILTLDFSLRKVGFNSPVSLAHCCMRLYMFEFEYMASLYDHDAVTALNLPLVNDIRNSVL
jgi:hypothetical protein